MDSKQNQARNQELTARKANQSDIDYVVHANQQIEGARAKLSPEVLQSDVFCPAPKAHVVVVETEDKPVGMAFYSFTYWASEGPILWVSQMYIEPEFRGGRAAKILRGGLSRQATKEGAKHMMWATHSTADRSNKLWKRIGAKDLSETYSFWVNPV